MEPGDVLGRDFYDRDPRAVAVDLLGCILSHETDEGATSGVIVETEAYLCMDDPACHAYRWPEMKNRTIFKGPGLAYVYLIYGRYPLINVNCEEEGKGSAVLIRALDPLTGLDLMAERRGKLDLCTGPGKLTQAFSIQMRHDAHDLTCPPLTLRYGGEPEGEILATTRIGLTRGTELPYRYLIGGNPNVSVPPRTVAERGLRRGGPVPT